MGDGRTLEPTPYTTPIDDSMDLQIVRTPVTLTGLEAMAERLFGNVVKAVVDVERGIMAVGGEMHADEEALLPAIAIANDLPLYTCNPGDFIGIDGPVVVAVAHPDEVRSTG